MNSKEKQAFKEIITKYPEISKQAAYVQVKVLKLHRYRKPKR